jgi:putative nucleotidyltransferase with HDIG domain
MSLPDRSNGESLTPQAEGASMSLLIAPDTLRKRVSELPAMPQAVQDVLAALRDDDVRIDDCANRIARDQALTALTLRLANSAFYGVPGRVATIQDAVQVLGLRTLSTLLQAAALVSRFPPSTCAAFQAATFWRNSIGTAISARCIAGELRQDANIAFTAGLLHDIGRLALATHFADAFTQALALQQKEDLPPLQAERHVLGADHAEVGAMVARHWHYPPTIVDAIARHHQPLPATLTPRNASITEVVHMANGVAHMLEQPAREPGRVPASIAASWARLGLSYDQYERVFQQTEVGVEALCKALGV